MADGKLTSAAGIAGALREVWEDVDHVVGDLDDAGWAAPTGCPGWTVHDCVAHLAGVESRILGRPAPEHVPPPDLPWVRSDIGRIMEVAVDWRRPWPNERVLADYREVVAARLAVVDRMDDAALDVEVDGLFGRQPLRGVLDIRLFDCWSHDQDIRRALRRPGCLDGPAAAHSRERMISGIARRLQERLAPAPGTSLTFDVVGASAATRTVVFGEEGGVPRSRVETGDGEGATARLRLDLETLTVLACGRADAEAARGRVEVSGDAALARHALEDLAITP